jgi:hypothetical protein
MAARIRLSVSFVRTVPALLLQVWNSNFATPVKTRIVRCVLYCPAFTDMCPKIKKIKGAYKGGTQ